MTDAARIAALEAQLNELAARLDPQTLRQALERTFDPRGGEPRIIDENGVTLDYVPSLQFLNATAVLDVPTQRVVVTGSASTPAAYRFSDDGVVAADEQIKFVDETTGATTRAVVGRSTTAAGTIRNFETTVSETDVTTQPRTRLTMRHDSTDATVANRFNDFTLSAEAQSGKLAKVTGTSNAGGTNVQAGLSAINDAGSGIASVVGSGTAGSAVLVANGQAVAANATAHCTVNGTTRYMYRQDDNASSYLQVCLSTLSTPTNAVSRTLRGPFTAAPGALAAGASTTVAVSNAIAGAAGSQAVLGGVSGAAGVEGVAWSWTSAGATVTISFTNLTAGPLTPTLNFYTLGDL